MSKVFYNINESTYCCSFGRFVFWFSRLPYIDKFLCEVHDMITNEQYKTSARYNVDCNIEELFLFYLYSRIEKNGCRIDFEGGTITCLNQVQLNGEIVMKNF